MNIDSIRTSDPMTFLEGTGVKIDSIRLCNSMNLFEGTGVNIDSIHTWNTMNLLEGTEWTEQIPKFNSIDILPKTDDLQ